MKTKSLILGVSAAGALLSTPAVMAQSAVSAVSSPVGYRTETIVPGFNLVGINLSAPIAVGGALDSVTATALTDNEATFTVGDSYVIKITAGASAGVVIEGTASSATQVDVTEDVTGLPGIATAFFEAREALEISEIFGDAATTTLLSGTATTADIVYIPAGSGTFTRVYSNGTSWRTVGSLGASDDEPVVFTDAVFVQRRGDTPVDVVFVGHVETVASNVALDAGFNFVSRVLPVETTLATSGLAANIGAGTANTADIVWIRNTDNGYDRFYLNASGDWRQIGSLGSKNDTELSSGVIIQSRNAVTGVQLTVPSTLDI